jgi:putative phosphoesterase
MLIGIVSDTHSRHQTVEDTIRILKERRVEHVLHCGDIEDPETIHLFAGLNAHFVFGNCDSDREGIRAAVRESGLSLQEPFGDLELAGKKIAFLHGDDKRLMRDVEHSGHFDFLFYGHTHQAEEHRTGNTRVINPGALHRARPKTFVLLDLSSGKIESVVIG